MTGEFSMTDTQTPALLSIKDLMVQYPTDEGVVKALDGVSLDIAPGQTLGVVGESGCGKSTVGRAILQILDRPGRVVGGEILWDARERGGETLDLAVQEPQRSGDEGASGRRHRHGVPGADDIVQPDPHYRQPDVRGDSTSPGQDSHRGARVVDRAYEHGGHTRTPRSASTSTPTS